MAIRFRCEHCNQLMSIASRQAGSMVPCPGCARKIEVPFVDQPTAAVPPQYEAAPEDEPPLEFEQPPSRSLESDAAEVDTNLVSFAQDEEPQHCVAQTDDREADDEGGFRLRGAKSEFGEMDLTPMVDVTFLLLIFFMVTASFSLQKSFEIPSPDPDQEGATQSIQTPEDLQENSIIVRIDENDAITIDFEPVIDPENLSELLLDKRRLEQKGDLVIDADERATHGAVVLVNDAAVDADFQHIRLAVRVPSN
jgi:biopolymer transport protein ExbD